MLNAIGAQGPTTRAGKQSFGILSALLPDPGFEDRNCRFGQGSTAFLTPLASTTYVCAGTERDVLVAQCRHLRQSETSLNSSEQKRMITAPQPLLSIRCRQQRFDLRSREKTHQCTRLSLVWNGQHPLDDSALGRRFQCSVTEE